MRTDVQLRFVRDSVSGIDDEAFDGPAKVPDLYALVFRKGDRAVSLASFLNPDEMKSLLSQEQLRALAKTILSA